MSSRNRLRARRVPENVVSLLFFLPSAAIILLVLLVPITYAIGLSLTDANLLNVAGARFIGIENYTSFFGGVDFKKVVVATVSYVVGGVGLTYIAGLIVALCINNVKRLRALFRGIIILPWAVPQVVLVIIWQWMINPQYGVLNYFLHSLSIIPRDFSWLTQGHFAMAVILSATLWKQYPLSFLILFAGLKTIPDELYEASSIDGATSLQKLFYITLPGLRHVTAGLVLLLTIWSFGNFVIVWLINHGGPTNRTATLTIWTFLNAFRFNKLGKGCAIGVLCLAASLLFSILYYFLFVKRIQPE